MSTLTHAQARAQLQAAADSGSAPTDQAALDGHLAECVECRAYAAELASLVAALPQALEHGLEATPLPAGLPARVLARWRGRPARQRFADAFALAFGAGAVAVMAAVFAWALGSQPAAVQPLQGDSLTATPTLPPWPSPDFTQQPLQSFPGLIFPGAGALSGFSLDQPDFSTLAITLLWMPADPPTPGLAAFVQIEDGAGQLVAQNDAPLPGSPWGATRYTLTIHPVTLPADTPGVYRLSAGVYDTATGARVLAEGAAAERLDLGQVAWPLPTATPLAPHGTPTPYLGGDLSAIPPATFTTCQVGCPTATATFPPSATPLPTWTPTPAVEASPTAAPTVPPAPTPWPIPSPTACVEGCPEASPIPWPTMYPYTETPLPAPLVTPCEGACPETSTPFPYTPEATYTPCQIGCPEATATPLPTYTPAP